VICYNSSGLSSFPYCIDRAAEYLAEYDRRKIKTYPHLCLNSLLPAYCYSLLTDSKGNKPLHLDISEDQWIEMVQNVRNGIFRKLNAVRKMLSIDKDIAAGIYVYAVEEFGKLMLLGDAPSLNGKRRVKYGKEFVKQHQAKIEKAFDYFRSNNFHICMILAQECPGRTSD
jgi:hypothetical protein